MPIRLGLSSCRLSPLSWVIILMPLWVFASTFPPSQPILRTAGRVLRGSKWPKWCAQANMRRAHGQPFGTERQLYTVPGRETHPYLGSRKFIMSPRAIYLKVF